MASLYFDTDIQPDFAGLLSAEGNQVLTARELRKLDATDGEHLAEATTRGLLLVTHNGNDFRTLCLAWHVWRRLWNLEAMPHAGVIAIPQRTRLPYARAAEEIGALLSRESNIWNQCWYFDLTAGDWVRQV
jgi:hypothetical protein